MVLAVRDEDEFDMVKARNNGGAVRKRKAKVEMMTWLGIRS